ncbi:VanW family protein [Mesobacillus harenae]|uniref:VanW family protein n=1 Tax=Mesobacillus harenae TaxID=2213203 RepID=UPI00157FFBA7|nr:VanW family protein [Mesobacillus harenae]
MGKRTMGFVFLLVLSFSVLAGCSGKTAKEEELEKKVAELEHKKEEDLKEERLKEEERKKAEQKRLEELRPVFVNVLDPETKEVLATFNTKEMGYGKDNEKYKAQIEKWAKDIARGTDTTPGYDQRMILDKLDSNGQVIKGKPGVILEEAELVDKVMKASEKGGTIELPLYVTASGYKMEDVSHLDEVVVASYTTYFNSGVAGRTKNIELSAEAINNIILGTGDYFSFNTTLGPSDAAHGYQPAEEAINGKLVMGIGGGICQTSSTLFNAVDQLGVTYVEKHHHSVTVGYVPKGRDATVSYGGKDFRFQNTVGVPLLLKAVMGKGSLIIEVRTSKHYQSLIKVGI